MNFTVCVLFNLSLISWQQKRFELKHCTKLSHLCDNRLWLSDTNWSSEPLNIDTAASFKLTLFYSEEWRLNYIQILILNKLNKIWFHLFKLRLFKYSCCYSTSKFMAIYFVIAALMPKFLLPIYFYFLFHFIQQIVRHSTWCQIIFFYSFKALEIRCYEHYFW